MAALPVAKFVLLCLALSTAYPVAAQETMDETTLRQHMIMAEGKPPDSYVETEKIRSNFGDLREVELHRGPDYKIMGGIGSTHGRLEGHEWDLNANGITTIHEPMSGAERPDPVKVSITRVRTPFDAWAYSKLNSGGSGTVEYIDPNTFRVLRVDRITYSGRIQTDYDDFRTINGYTTAFHWKIDNEYSRTQSETNIVTFEPRAVTDADLAIPPTKQLISFPAGVSSVELPARFIGPHIIVRVTIGGRGLDFILDTGASGIFIDSSVAHDLGLNSFGARSVVTAGRYEAANATVPEMQIGTLTMHNVVVATGPLNEQPVPDTKAVGLLGYDFIRCVGLTIDYEHKRVTAADFASFTPPATTARSDVLPIRLGTHQPMIAVSVNGSLAGEMVVDTGAANDIMFFDYFSRRYPEAFNVKVAKRVTGVARYRGIGGMLNTEVYRLQAVDIGKFELRDFDALKIVTPQAYEGDGDGIIGPGMLIRFTVTFDYADGKMYLVRNES